MELVYEKFRDEEEKLQYMNSEKKENTVFATHFHESTEIVYLEKGEIETTVNGIAFTARSGDAVFVNRFDLHSYKSYKGTVTHVFIMGKKISEPFFRGSHICFPTLLKDKAANTEIFGTVLNLIKYAGSETTDTGIACLLFGLLLKFYSPVKSDEKKETHIVRQIVEYIDVHYSENITLNSLSSEFGYSANYFSKLFNQYLGMHLRDYLNTLRAYKVKSILENDATHRITVTEAYTKCGFDSQSTFYRSYNKAYGKSPQRQNKKS